MGLLYKSVKLQQAMKQNVILEQLKERGITHSNNGTSIDDLSYKELKYELVMAHFRDIDVTKGENKWF